MSGNIFALNSVDETYLSINSEFLSNKNRVCAGSSLLLQSTVNAGQTAYLNSVVVMNLSLPMIVNRFVRTWAESYGSFRTSTRAGMTFRTSVFFSNFSRTFVMF